MQERSDPSAAVAAREDEDRISPAESVEVSVVIPCLNEADTIAACVATARRALHDAGIHGEVIVADNGSTDDSAAIARHSGARVVHVTAPGYGNALAGGIDAARGRFVIMGDADESYDFADAPKFVAKLRAGYTLVQGCRLPGGGGTIRPNAMPWLHRWLGNPMLTLLARWWFRTPVHDIYCGMRGFTADLVQRLNVRSAGMEFAAEMIIKASLHREPIAEVAITLHRDGRTAHPPHLRTFRDGWRTLRLFLLFSPRWLFLVPGVVLSMVGAAGYAAALPGLTINGVGFDVHTLLFASLSIVAGHQAIAFAIFTKSFAVSEGFLPADSRMIRFFRVATLERGLLLGGACVVAGIALLASTALQWWRAEWGPLDYPVTMRWAIPGATLTVVGLHTMFASFFVSILTLRRR